MARRRRDEQVVAALARSVDRHRLSHRLAWGAVGALLAIAQVTLVLASRVVDRVYATDRSWLVASYAEPWSTGGLILAVFLTVAAATRVAFSPARPPRKELVLAMLTMLVACAVCLELTTAVHYNAALGKLYVHTFLYRRAEVSLSGGVDGRCAADLGAFVWDVNGTALHPRLLPLPYSSDAVEDAVCRACGTCQ
jgi:hypothetical protein